MPEPFALRPTDTVDCDIGEDTDAWTKSREERRRLYNKYFDHCDYYEKWSTQAEPLTEEDAGEHTLYLHLKENALSTQNAPYGETEEAPLGSARGGDYAHVKLLEQQAGVELSDELEVTHVHTGSLAAKACIRTGSVVTTVSGGKVMDKADVETIVRRYHGQDCHLPVSFQVTVVKTLHHEKKVGTRNVPPHIACHRSKEHVDISVSGLLGFSVSGGLKVFNVRSEKEDRTPAKKAGLRNGLVVRKIQRRGEWVPVRSKRDFRRHIVDEYEEAAAQQQGELPGPEDCPEVTIKIQFAQEPETPGELAAREFHTLCGELEWKGRSTAAIDMYDRLKNACGWLSHMFEEGEDAKMQDFKRYVSIFFVKTWEEQMDDVSTAVDDVRTTTVKSEGTRTQQELHRMVYQGMTTRNPLSNQLKSSSRRRCAPSAQGEAPSGLSGQDGEGAQPQNYNHGLADMDAYGTFVLKLLKARIAEEVEEVSKARVGIFYCAIVQFILALCVFSVSAEDMPSNGGKFAPFIATTCAAGVGVISAILGFIGGLGGGANIEQQDEMRTGDDMPELGEPNETMMGQFLACNCWLLAILTAFLYSEILELDESQLECGGMNPGDVPAGLGLCEEAITRHSTLVGICGAMLVVVFLGIVFCNNLLDSVNDKAKLDSKELFMTYFRVRFFEGKVFMAKHLPNYVATNYLNRLDNDTIMNEVDQAQVRKASMRAGRVSATVAERTFRRGSVIVDGQADGGFSC
eukprot:TRINITY_DN1878_c0_g1_i1.p1 TRINITY_DN1878_c0_g1~~TRINITY_DN1878_c0_g1_i1.p1  ORF type:complete len:788 (+),score=281.65 TRINITY_DN1878_c0_g1_i1:137-2365(+)